MSLSRLEAGLAAKVHAAAESSPCAARCLHGTALLSLLSLCPCMTMKIAKIGTYLITGDAENVLLLHPHIFGIEIGNSHSHAIVAVLTDIKFISVWI